MPIEPSKAGSQRYLALDTLRGTAALVVMLYHLRTIGSSHHEQAGLSLFASGYLAVDLFFALSGFVIAHAYEDKLRGNFSFKAFIAARFVRLQPVIAVGTLLGFAIALSRRVLGACDAPGLFAIATALPVNLMMLPDVFVPWGIFLLNPPAWSLFYELLANAGYAWSVRGRHDRQRACRFTNRLTVACLLTGLTGLCISVIARGELDGGVVLGEWPVALSRVTYSFALGVFLHRTRTMWMPRVPGLNMFLWMLACMVLLAPNFGGMARAIYDLAFVTLLSPLLVMGAAAATLSRRQSPFAAWLGLISYPLYAVHVPLKHIIETVAPWSFWPLLASTAFCAIAAAWIIGDHVDPPARRWLAKRLRHHRPSWPKNDLPGGL